ncbi:hypothetical protein Glove_522g95 [Diversispora epigaea]|uniref:Protein kinase domain-containing protein n=1 Tax=Diversispora epigaea TaxID=1348612 RepID=A0A397GE73_9GLOM|nr:hypothetical protein Glove_522g95 [Diversispora epigaea]
MDQYVCEECKQAGIWCKSCNAKRFREEFEKWTSGDTEIDEFIKEIQLKATKHEEVIEWIPFDRFEKVEYLDAGGFGTVYKAKWRDGYIVSWDPKEKNWLRKSEWKYICLKSLNTFEHTRKFLQEIKNQLKFRGGWAIAAYGLTKNPTTNDYMIVMQYAQHGSLRKMLNNEFSRLDWHAKLKILLYIAFGLAKIHECGLMHKDLHPGNVVLESLTDPYITDFGLCKPVLQDLTENDQNKIYGVIPYTAPEIFTREYTWASDVYSFGMIMLEVFTSYPPYYNTPHDINLIMSICNGQKPEIKFEIPQLLRDLMERCWDSEPRNRPTAKELETQFNEYYYQGNDELNKQIKDIEELNKNFIQYNPNEVHPQAKYTSRPLPAFDRTSNSRQIFMTLPSDSEIMNVNASDFVFSTNGINENEEVNENNKIIRNKEINENNKNGINENEEVNENNKIIGNKEIGENNKNGINENEKVNENNKIIGNKEISEDNKNGINENEVNENNEIIGNKEISKNNENENNKSIKTMNQRSKKN